MQEPQRYTALNWCLMGLSGMVLGCQAPTAESPSQGDTSPGTCPQVSLSPSLSYQNSVRSWGEHKPCLVSSLACSCCQDHQVRACSLQQGRVSTRGACVPEGIGGQTAHVIPAVPFAPSCAPQGMSAACRGQRAGQSQSPRLQIPTCWTVLGPMTTIDGC